MRAYVIRRLLLVVPTLFVMSLIVFLSVRFIPGDFIDVMLGKNEFMGQVDRAAVERMLGLDVPAHVQYVRWLGDIVLHGSLGHSLVGGRAAVEEKIIGRLPVTIQLGLMSIVIGLVLALPVGIYSAIRQDTAADYARRSVAIIGLATANFWLGIMVMIYPVIWWGWSPPMEMIRFTEDPLGSLGVFIIPSVILGTYLSAATMRITRTMMGRGVPQLIVVLGISGGIGGSRLIRGAVIDIKENAYFQATEVIGASRWRTFVHHILPNIMPVVIVIFSINVGGVIISEASLSFLGFGLPPDVPSWGAMLSREGRQYMQQGPWLALWPGLCLTIVVYSLNMFGDAVRDLLDPRLRGGGGRLGAGGA